MGAMHQCNGVRSRANAFRCQGALCIHQHKAFRDATILITHLHFRGFKRASAFQHFQACICICICNSACSSMQAHVWLYGAACTPLCTQTCIHCELGRVNCHIVSDRGSLPPRQWGGQARLSDSAVDLFVLAGVTAPGADAGEPFPMRSVVQTFSERSKFELCTQFKIRYGRYVCVTAATV